MLGLADTALDIQLSLCVTETSDFSACVLNTAWDTLILKIIGYLPDILIHLRVLYFYLLNLETLYLVNDLKS